MRFSFDDQQLEFKAQMRSFTEKRCTPTDVRDAWASDLGWSRSRWSALGQMGVLGVSVPEHHGGLGLGMLDLVLLLEEAGRACLPEPLLETVAIGVPVLLSGTGARAEELRHQWLSRFATGEAVLGVGIPRASLAAGSSGADLLVLEHDGRNGSEFHVVPADEVSLRPLRSLDGSSRVAEVKWQPSSSTRIASGEDAKRMAVALVDCAATGAAALLIGVADAMITMTALYARERHQFGKPIGSFQAVKHHLANALIKLEFAKPLVYRSAWSLDVGDPSTSVYASMAKAQASDAAVLAARTALQVHGAIGYTWEHDLHLWMKRAWSLASAWGDAGAHRSRVLDAFAAAGTDGG